MSVQQLQRAMQRLSAENNHLVELLSGKQGQQEQQAPPPVHADNV